MIGRRSGLVVMALCARLIRECYERVDESEYMLECTGLKSMVCSIDCRDIEERDVK